MTSREHIAQTELTDLFKKLPNTEIYIVKLIVDYICTEEEEIKDIVYSTTNEQYLSKYYTRFGMREGLSKTYILPENYIYSTEEYVNGIPNGIKKYYRKNGKIYMQMTLKQGNLTGEHKTWYHNGQLETQCYYINYNKEGKYLMWYPNGVLMLQELYINRKKYYNNKNW
jgi:antitoxin component YwqK of YwqJK toxin-antitoxin module